MPLAGLPAPLGGWAVVPSVASVLVSTGGLALLRLTRPSMRGGHASALYVGGLLGIFGILLSYAGLVLEAVPMLVGVATDSEGTAAAVARCAFLPACWLVERLSLLKRPLEPLISCLCAIVFVGSVLVEWAGPRPYDNVSLGLPGQIAGCDGGYRSPFLIYASLWLTSILFGTLLIFVAGTRCGGDGNVDVDSSPVPSEFLRRRALPLLHGLCVSMAGILFATGAASNDMRWILLGAVLLAIAVICAWDWLWRLELSLVAWACMSQACLIILRLIQGHLVFRDFRWAAASERGLLAVGKWPGLQLFLFGILMLYATLLFFFCLNLSDAALGEGASPNVGAGAEDGELQKVTKTRLFSVDSIGDETLEDVIRPLPLVAWALFPVCVCTLVLGVSLPVIHYDMMPPDLVYVSAYTVRTDSGIGYHTRTTQSYLDLITNLYDRRLPCSALAVACSSAILPPIQFALIVVLLTQPSCIPREVQQFARSMLMNTAPSRFSGPMLLMLYISILNFSGPGTHYFRASLGSGFWFFVGYCIASLLLALSLEIDADRHSLKSSSIRLRQMLSPCGPCGCKLEDGIKPSERSARSSSWRPATVRSRESRSDEDGHEDFERESSASSNENEEEQNCLTVPLACVTAVAVLLTLAVGVATYVGLTEPFFVFEYRLSGVVVDTARPTALELWYDMMETNRWLGRLAAVTLVLAMLLWLPLLFSSVTLTLRGNVEVVSGKLRCLRRAEMIVRPVVMGHVWAAAMVCILYMVMARNKAVMEVCVRMPEHPHGFVAVATMGVTVLLFHELAKFLGASTNVRESSALVVGGLLRLPGGACLWMLAPIATVAFCAVTLYRHGPHEPRTIQNLGDVNDVLSRLSVPMQERLQAHLPWSAGDCEELWQWRLSREAVSANSEKYLSCIGHGPLAKISKENPFGKGNMSVKASWATGLSSMKLTGLRVQPPANISAQSQRWTLIVGGKFTELQVYMKVMMGDKLWIDNDPMCCTNPFHFAVELSATCRRGGGFDNVKLEVVHIDKIEFVHSVSRTSGINHASYQINYGSSDVVVKSLENFMTLKNAEILISNPDRSTTDPLSRMGSVLEHIVSLNTGYYCPHSY